MAGKESEFFQYFYLNNVRVAVLEDRWAAIDAPVQSAG